MGLRTGTPDAEATITTRSARLDLESRVGGRRSSSGDRRPSFCAAARLGDRPPFARARHPLVAAVPNPCRQPVGRACREALRRSRYAAPARRCPTSGTASPCGSSPEPIAARRAAARATTPFADGNGATASSSPWTTATSTGAGAADPPVTRSANNASRSAPRTGRPGSLSGSPVDVGEVGGGKHVQPRQRLQRRRAPRPRSRPVASAARTAPANTGSVTTSSRRSAPRARGTPVKRRRRRAARSAASAADAAHPVRFTGWLCSATTASRARRTASSTPGSAAKWANGSRLIRLCCHRAFTGRGARP